MFGTLLAGKFQFLQISERYRAPRHTAKLKPVTVLPYFHRFLNLASTLRIHLARQAHLQTLSQNHKTLQISSQIFQTCSKKERTFIYITKSGGKQAYRHFILHPN